MSNSVLAALSQNDASIQEAVEWRDGGNWVYEYCADCVDTIRVDFDFDKSPVEVDIAVKVLQAGMDYEGNDIFTNDEVVCRWSGVVEASDIEGVEPTKRQMWAMTFATTSGSCPGNYGTSEEFVIDITEGWWARYFTTPSEPYDPAGDMELSVGAEGWAQPIIQCLPADQDADGFCPLTCQANFNFDTGYWFAAEDANGGTCSL